MKLLTNNEINNVSGAKLDLGDGLFIEVSSVGIPQHAYSFIDSLVNQVNHDQITTNAAAAKIFNAGYSYYFDIYQNHFQNGHYTFHFA